MAPPFATSPNRDEEDLERGRERGRERNEYFRAMFQVESFARRTIERGKLYSMDLEVK